ncbi:DUF2461 domain-containing protein [Chryseolinea lacunae]|uniref:DUF2461 domain-containing protein n=1 Tax=Chryseolinea lacunae TaxID=2801331 RepID=A0ABS1L147_9BACT|nr:DUF2461 domain-containing protein [Chryseolinea lacunae]MBL0744276.1 DUF2461 domain-containing protein [Chryseolinea lacunae]
MPDIQIHKSTFDFLKKLAANNNREWFQQNKHHFEKAKENTEQVMDALIAKMNVHDQLETPSGKKSLYRIYNDVRFAKDKSPYSPRFAGYLRRVKPFLRGGYYIWIKPGATRVACGFAYPNPSDLKRIREDMAMNLADWKKLLRTKSIVNTFGSMTGEQVKTTPRGFDASDPSIALLRYKQYWFERTFTDREALAHDFLKTVNQTFKSIRPFFDYVSDVLTTDGNGEPV